MLKEKSSSEFVNDYVLKYDVKGATTGKVVLLRPAKVASYKRYTLQRSIHKAHSSNEACENL